MKQKSDRSGHFFLRMLFISIALMTVFMLASSLLLRRLLQRYEQDSFLMNYELAITSLSEVFRQRVVDGPTLAGQFLENSDCHPMLCSLLEADSYDELPAPQRSALADMLSSIIGSHSEIDGILLYSIRGERLYLYTSERMARPYSAGMSGLLNIKPFSGQLLGQEEIGTLVTLCAPEKASGRHYGSAFTIFRKPSEPLGYMIPLYSVRAFDSVLSGYRLDSGCILQIHSEDGKLIYSSSREEITEDVFEDEIGGKGYTVSYRVPRASLTYGALPDMIFLISLLVIAVAFIIAMTIYVLSGRRVNRILEGMNRFSMDNLSYRIPVPRTRDEFSGIIESFNSMCAALEDSVSRSYIYELQQKRSDLYALQTAIDPHFLYNTLEMIRSSVAQGHTADAEQMVLLLSRIYRGQTSTDMFVSLEREVEVSEDLMQLYQYRFKNFEYEFDIAPGLRRFALPRNTLQPLIENYFVHGIVPERQDNVFLMDARWEQPEGSTEGDRRIRLRVRDNGNGMDKEAVRRLQGSLEEAVYDQREAKGFALTNIYSRLKIAFGEGCELRIDESSGGGFAVELLFPARTALELSDRLNGSGDAEGGTDVSARDSG